MKICFGGLAFAIQFLTHYEKILRRLEREICEYIHSLQSACKVRKEKQMRRNWEKRSECEKYDYIMYN